MVKKKEEKDEVLTPPAKDVKKKDEFQALIEKYKEQNPVKYEIKKDRLKEKLASL